ncbi:peptidase B [Striga asiatica]|uniref:Peptidase B n=1 Tax=Striga asiatica TaxID=4170 RepID=A0A5A7Q1D3_STRAF|nr:peptidase B [Striga asiatica]
MWAPSTFGSSPPIQSLSLKHTHRAPRRFLALAGEHLAAADRSNRPDLRRPLHETAFSTDQFPRPTAEHQPSSSLATSVLATLEPSRRTSVSPRSTEFDGTAMDEKHAGSNGVQDVDVQEGGATSQIRASPGSIGRTSEIARDPKSPASKTQMKIKFDYLAVSFMSEADCRHRRRLHLRFILSAAISSLRMPVDE